MKYLMILIPFAFAGCMRPYDVPEFYEIGNSHTAFLVPMEGSSKNQEGFDSEELLKEKMVAVKRVQIPHQWVQTGRWYTSGHYIQTLRLICVDRAPVTRQLTADAGSGTSKSNQAIWVESKDSVGFSTGISITAHIPTDIDAVKFLYKYPSQMSMKLHDSNGDGVKTLEPTGYGLEYIIDTEVRAQIQSRMATFAAMFNMDELREKKNEMLSYVKHGNLPEGVELAEKSKQVGVLEFFNERGIEITELGQFGGFTYENVEIQRSIDAVFKAQQDEEVAKAEYRAQVERNKTVEEAAKGKAKAAQEEAKGKGEATKTTALAEAQAIKDVADAKAYEIEKALQNLEVYIQLKQLENQQKAIDKWDGRQPTWLFGGQGAPAELPNVMVAPPKDVK